MDPDRARRLRRRLWGVAFLFAVGLLVWQTLGRHEQIRVTLVLELGPDADRVSQIDGELWAGDEVAGTFERTARPGAPMGTPRFSVAVPQKDIAVTVRIHVPGRVIAARRTIVAEAGATISVPLARDVSAAPP